MNEHLRKQIFSNMNRKETHELIEMWQENDRSEWSAVAFDVVREILQNRLTELPSQSLPNYHPSKQGVNEEPADIGKEIKRLWGAEVEVKPSVQVEPAKPIPVGLAILGLLLFCPGALLFFFAVGQSVTDLINDMGSSRWPTTSGHIISSSIYEWQESEEIYFGPRVEYEYVVGEHSYRSKRIRFGGFVPTFPDASRAEAMEVYLRYPSGETVQVYFDPNIPSLSVLEPGVGESRILFLTAILVSLLVISCLFARACALSLFERWRPKRGQLT